MALMKFQLECNSCEKNYLVLVHPEEIMNPSYCPFCGVDGVEEPDNHKENEEDE